MSEMMKWLAQRNKAATRFLSTGWKLQLQRKTLTSNCTGSSLCLTNGHTHIRDSFTADIIKETFLLPGLTWVTFQDFVKLKLY